MDEAIVKSDMHLLGVGDSPEVSVSERRVVDGAHFNSLIYALRISSQFGVISALRIYSFWMLLTLKQV